LLSPPTPPSTPYALSLHDALPILTFPATRVNMLGSNFMRIIFKTNQRSHFLQEFLAAVTLLESLPFGFQLISQINVSPLDGIFIFELAVDLPCLCYLQLLFGMDR